MFERFIVATDLSPASSAVVKAAGGLRSLGAEQCLLLQCLSMAEAASAGLAYNVKPLEQLLEAQKAELERSGFRVEARTTVGSPKREIVRVAVKEDYALIVIGSQGHSLAEERLLGGVAYGVLNRSAKPVLVIPVEMSKTGDDTCAPMCRTNFAKHVVFATDFSDASDRAFTHVEDLVTRGVKKVTLLHVQDQTKLAHLSDRLKEFDEIDRGRLEVFKKRLVAAGQVEVDIEIVHGVPYLEIMRFAKECDGQLVVMGTQGRGFVGELFLGSVSQHVARTSPAPVLLIPVGQ